MTLTLLQLFLWTLGGYFLGWVSGMTPLAWKLRQLDRDMAKDKAHEEETKEWSAR